MKHSRITAPLALAASSMVSGQTMTFELADIASWDGLGSQQHCPDRKFARCQPDQQCELDRRDSLGLGGSYIRIRNAS